MELYNPLTMPTEETWARWQNNILVNRKLLYSTGEDNRIYVDTGLSRNPEQCQC